MPLSGFAYRNVFLELAGVLSSGMLPSTKTHGWVHARRSLYVFVELLESQVILDMSRDTIFVLFCFLKPSLR